MHYIRTLFEAMSLIIVSKFDVKCFFLSPQIKIFVEVTFKCHTETNHYGQPTQNNKNFFFLSLLTPMISYMNFYNC